MSHVQFENSVLDTSVEKIPVSGPDGYSTKGFHGIFVGGNMVASCKEAYTIIPNRELYELAVESADNFGISIEHLKSFNEGSKIAIQSEKASFFVGDNEVESRLSFINSHDGSISIGAGLSTLTLVCSNQFHRAMKELSKFRHTSGVKEKMQFFLRAMEQHHNEEEKLRKYFNDLANTKVSQKDFSHAINLCMNFGSRAKPVNILDSKWGEDLSTQRYNKTVDIIGIAQKTLRTHGGTNAWALLNVFTDVTTNYLSTPSNRALVEVQGHKLQTLGEKFVNKTTGLVLN